MNCHNKMRRLVVIALCRREKSFLTALTAHCNTLTRHSRVENQEMWKTEEKLDPDSPEQDFPSEDIETDDSSHDAT